MVLEVTVSPSLSFASLYKTVRVSMETLLKHWSREASRLRWLICLNGGAGLIQTRSAQVRGYDAMTAGGRDLKLFQRLQAGARLWPITLCSS